MKRFLGEIGETVLGAAWWGSVWVWGGLMTAALVLAPLILANLVVELVDTVPATPALAAGVIGAYAIGLPPWDAEERLGLLLIIGGAAASVVGWDLLRGSADIGTLLIALSLALLGWPIRRAISGRLLAGR
ncbi:MAG TPA: hypothetical protein VLA76_01745 [Candidatus Angelobacter sp.]|nr:hypothetical protein [Candidatus Angelobacter sp.]